jgi:filamentous hemagglutinin family protein
MSRRLHRVLSSTTAELTTLVAFMALAPMPAAGGPNGGTVVGGSATIAGAGSNSVTINQSTQSAIINWQTFNIGAGEATRFNQPNSSSIALNRVVGGLGPSQILGTLSANGRVFVINGDGILFGANAVVNTAGFLATTNDIRNEDFMAGKYNFTIPGRPSASIVNLGTITAASGGFAALVAPGVRNSGTITATLGTVSLASGNSFTLDFYGDKLITLAVNDQIASKVIDVATGQPLKSLVRNTGKLSANGGSVELTAAAARAVVNSVINNKGVIEANSIGSRNGRIVLGAATGASKPAGAPTQTVKLSGKISVAGKDKGTSGGTVVVTGENIVLAGVTIDASGQTGGGTVLVGGDWSGGHPTVGLVSNASAQLETYWVPTATTVSVDAGSTIDASAKNTGNGGKVIVWADQSTTFNGAIFAQGGALSGNGGFVETSGKQSLSVQTGTVNTDAPLGKIGDWLLDPANIIVAVGGSANLSNVSSFGANPGTTQTIAPGTIGSAVSNVTLQATQDITFNAPINMINNRVGLTAQAGRNISVNTGASITTRGGNIVLSANDPATTQLHGFISLNAPLRTNAGGFTGGTVTLNDNGGGEVLLGSSIGDITTAGGAIVVGGAPIRNSSTNTILTFDTTGGGSFSSGANINFTNFIATSSFGGQRLTLNAGGGDINFSGNVTVGGMAIGSARNVTAAGFITANKFFTNTNQTGNLTIPGGISTRGNFGATIPGNANAGPVNIATTGNVTVGTNSNSFIIAFGGDVLSTGAGGNGADVTIRAGGNVTLSGIDTSGGVPKNGSRLGGNAGNISITSTGGKISLLGEPTDPVTGLSIISLNADGGPNRDTNAFLANVIAGRGGNITLNGDVTLRGGPSTGVHIDNLSNGPATNIVINGQIDATTSGTESLVLIDGHGNITTGNIGANVRLANVIISDDFTGSIGSVSATSLTRNASNSNASFETTFGPSTTTFRGPVDISGDVTLRGTNLVFANYLRAGGDAVIGSANLSAQSVFIGGHTRIATDTTINTSQTNGAITMGAIDGTTPFTQSLTLNAGSGGRVTTGDVGDTVPLKNFKVIAGIGNLGRVNPDTFLTKRITADAVTPSQTAVIANLISNGINTTTAGSTPLSLLGVSSPISSSAIANANSILNSAGIDYVTMPALSDLLAMELLKLPLANVSDSGYWTNLLIKGLKDELKNRNISPANIGAFSIGFLGGIIVDVVANVWSANAPSSWSPQAVELVRYGIEAVGNGVVASLQTKNPAIGFSIGLIVATAGEVTDAFKAGLGLFTDIQQAKAQIATLNALITSTDATAQKANAVGDLATYQRLLQSESSLKDARDVLQSWVNNPF